MSLNFYRRVVVIRCDWGGTSYSIYRLAVSAPAFFVWLNYDAMKKDLALVIQDEMDKRGWSDTITAYKSGVPQSTIYRIVNRQVIRPHKSTLTMLAAAFGMTYSQLLSLVNADQDRKISVDEISAEADELSSAFAEADRQIRIIYKSMCQAIAESGKTLSAEEVVLLFKDVLEDRLKPRLVHEPLDEAIKTCVKNAKIIKN